MASDMQTAPASKAMFWGGWIMSILPVLMLLMSAAMKFMQPPEMKEGIEKLGWQMHHVLPLGIVELTSVVLYLFPRTAALGAILITGYLGGAIATHMRIGDPFVPAMLVPIILGVLVWGGLWLRDARVRSILPLR